MNNSTNNNVSIPNLIRIINDGSTSNNARNDATQKLKYLEDQRFADYILELCRILGSRQEQEQTRQGAGLLLKNCIGAAKERSEQYINKIKKRWNAQDPNVRNRLKNTVIAILGVPDRAARDTAINVISNLASIESISQQNGWNDLIPQLIKKCLDRNTTNDLTYSALKCIAQIAEDESHHDDLQRYSPKILECIANGMSQNSAQQPSAMAVQTEAMKCLYHFVELISQNMKIEKERTIIFQMVCCGASQTGNNELKLSSFMVFSRLIEYYYDILTAYMQHIFQISKQTIEKGINNHEDEDVTKQAIEVWSTCAEIEYDIKQDLKENPNSDRKNFGFVNKSLELLVPIYLKALLKQKDEFDPDEWTIRKAAACSLELFALVAGDNILSFVLKFVEQNISLSNWRGREAALGAFGYILDGPSQNKLVQLTSQILPIILKLMGDQNVQVRTTAVWAFGRVCDLIPDAVGNKNILQPLVKAISDGNGICNKACWCIASLTKYYNVQKINGSCIYSESNAFKLIKELLNRCTRSDCDGNVVIALHEAINNIIYYLPPSDQNAQNIKSLLPELVGQMLDCSEKCMKGNDNNNTQSMDIVMHRMAGLFSSIQVILDLFSSKLGRNCLDEGLTNKIMHCCCALLSKDNDLVYEEALGCITYVARCIGANFKVYLEAQHVQQLLIKSIRIGNKNQEICRIGAGVIGDVYTSCTDFITQDPMKLQSYTDRIVSELLTILIQNNNDDMSIQLKGHIVDALTDILIAHGRHAYRYSGDILDKCLKIGCLIPPKEWDQDMMTDFNEIRCSIIDTCRTCMAELAQAGQISGFGQQYLPKIHNFFNAISQDINRISINVLKSCIKLLHEAADYCDTNTKRKLQTQSVQNILSKAGSMTQNEPELAEHAKQAFQQISRN